MMSILRHCFFTLVNGKDLVRLLQCPKPFDLRSETFRLFQLKLQRRAQLLANDFKNGSAVLVVYVNAVGHSEVSFRHREKRLPLPLAFRRRARLLNQWIRRPELFAICASACICEQRV
ncbi:hypothetical protein DXU07_41060 [Bradyrhizobium elkanii]|jgi:hypothetical protein|nr:hypothetical protein [Bradyrhizobium elkanii]NWL73362.1 hypothetical protein [Bradyrhizobium elkanii]OIM94212.1 hypothetical protein BLN97_11840 [Bradyrhizobium elkanii]RYM31734.1 hypothetical protein EWH13_03480 [Bradyrhizobium elkanii]